MYISIIPIHNKYVPYNIFHDVSSLPLLLIAMILGRNSKQSVDVVAMRIKLVIVIYASVARSEMIVPITTTLALVITTEYTLIPMYLESFRADISTFLVSQAMYTPTIRRRPL